MRNPGETQEEFAARTEREYHARYYNIPCGPRNHTVVYEKKAADGSRWRVVRVDFPYNEGTANVPSWRVVHVFVGGREIAAGGFRTKAECVTHVNLRAAKRP